MADGRVRVRLKRAWHDGTTHLLFEPLEFLEKLAALTSSLAPADRRLSQVGGERGGGRPAG